MKTQVIGFPRVGQMRELKFATEKFFKGDADEAYLQAAAKELRLKHLRLQSAAGIDFIPSNDFSFYDGMLDLSVMLGVLPHRYASLGLSALETYFAAARGYQGAKGDVKALAMKKWFNTNYHYMVPEIEDGAVFKLNADKVLGEFNEAKAAGILTAPALIGPFTFAKLSRYTGAKTQGDVLPYLAAAYIELLAKLGAAGAERVFVQEPILVTDLSSADVEAFAWLYEKILTKKGGVKVALSTYFGHISDAYCAAAALDFDGIGLDFVEGKAQNLALIAKHGFPKGKTLFAGLVNGKNIWKNNYAATAADLAEIKAAAGGAEIVLSTSCSLLHVPFTVAAETALGESKTKHMAYAVEKLTELKEIAASDAAAFEKNKKLFAAPRVKENEAVKARLAALKAEDFVRKPYRAERRAKQKAKLNLPLLPTTTIGSFPQTADVKKNRAFFKAGQVGASDYKQFNKEKIKSIVEIQEKLGLDVLVHGEYERNDMVEYFGECLDGYVFTQYAWVQSYGTRCVKPPVVWGDVARKKSITVEYSSYAQSLTKKPMKGMLTGPVTILNWSFPREDAALETTCNQIALAIRDEVLDLERAGISIIQIDEAALREKLPLRRADRQDGYLAWAIPSFRLVTSGVKAETQIHTHMCYSEFGDIITDIDAMDADVISFEASRSDLKILDDLKAASFQTEVGPGVYDIHSPRVPSVKEITAALTKMLEKIDPAKLWVNPDCGLKTRGEKETFESLANLVEAAREVRGRISEEKK